MITSITEADLWARLDLNHLLVLDAVARAGSFWAAADLLDCSQSAVSQQVAMLERIVGHRLIERSPGRREINLTEPGRLLLTHAEAIAARLKAARADLSAYSEGAVGVLGVGSYQSVGQRVVPNVLKRFVVSWPQVEVRLEERNSESELLNLVERGELDLTFGLLPLRPGPFTYVELLRDPYVVVIPASWPLANSDKQIRIRDLRCVPFVANRSSCHSEVDAFLRRRNVDPREVFTSADNGTVQAAVAAGLGVAVVPELTVDHKDQGVRVLKIEELPWRTLVLVWHRDRYRSPAARGFEESAVAVCASLD